MVQQLNYAINENRRIGESKRAYKMSHEGKTDAKIFSNLYAKSLHDTAKSLGKFMREMYPDVRMANQIKSEHVQAYINTMSPNWSRKTMETKISAIKKIGECIRTTFPTKEKDYGNKADYYRNDSDVGVIDKSYYGNKSDYYRNNAKTSPFIIEQTKTVRRESVRDVAMDKEDFQLLLRNMKPGSNARICIEITYRCGLRVNEVACLRRSNININKRCLELREGTKTGKWRDVPIRDKDMAFFRELVANTQHEYVTRGIQPGSLNKAIRRKMKEVGIAEKYLRTTDHSIRKTYASERMEEERALGKSERAGWSVVQYELGHGAGFRHSLYVTYVKS